MGYCSYCGNWVDEGSICSHCGGAGGHKDSDEEEDGGRRYITRFSYLNIQASECSKRGDHISAIEFYREAFNATRRNEEKCQMLSAIAGEYETMGYYASAEEYWTKCCVTDNHMGIGPVKVYVADKGDFLYRIGRYGEAIDLYERALKGLREMKGLFNLRYYARIVHFIIDSYDKLGKGDVKEKYHNELKHGIDRFIQAGGRDKKIIANAISKTAWDIYEDEWLVDEALILIDSAIELGPGLPAFDYMRKAKMLQGSFKYEEALKCYDIALAKGGFEKEILKVRAECEAECIKSRLELDVLFKRIEPKHLDMINRALKILPDDSDNVPYLHVKAEILNQLGDPVKAWICRYIAAERYDEVGKIEKQLKKMKSCGTYINITGIHYYQGFEPFKEGTVFDLIREPENPHDRDAIRVEINGETVGYVANSRFTLIKEVKSATEIKNTSSTRAEVQFILFNEWVIAKLI